MGAVRTVRDPSGRAVRKHVSAKPGSEVVEELRALQRRIGEGLLPQDGNATVLTLFERRSQDVMRHHVESSTSANYVSITRIHIRPHVGHKKLADLKVNGVGQLLSIKFDRGLAAPTVRRIRRALAQCLDQGIR